MQNKKKAPAVTLVIIVALGLWLIAWNWASDAASAESDSMASHVGEQVTIGRDTLVVTDFSVMLETYTLSNGVKVDKSLVEKK